MAFVNTKFEVSDPAFYDTLISDQKRKVRRDLNSAEKWLELGRLQEAKVEMTKCFVEKSFMIRWLVVFTYALFLSASLGLYFAPFDLFHVLSWKITMPAFIFCLISLIYSASARYPRSGDRYFKKAISLDPELADAYMYLGLIALRRHQKKRAYSLLEEALKKGGGKNIERELKTVYEKEFTIFFDKKTKKEKELQCTITPLLNENITLKAEVANLKNRNAAVTKKAHHSKLEAGRIMRRSETDMADRFEEIRQNYEKQIVDLEQAMEAEEEEKEIARKNVSNLTLEIMEAKALDEKMSFEQSAKTVEDIMGTPAWLKLSDQTRSCLVTAEHAFSLLDKSSEDTDFSLVGMELCKALETEINKVLVQPFAKSLNGRHEEFLRVNQTGDQKGKPIYFTYLAKVVDNTSYPEIYSLTLGQYLFSLKKTLEGEYALDEYGNFLDKISGTTGIGAWRIFLQKLKIVTNEYRNSIVHHAHMNIGQYEHLRELAFKGKNSLLIQCSNILWHG